METRIRGVQRILTIGRHGKGAWGPESARREAQRLLGMIRDGKDPATERAEAKAAPTLEELSTRYLAEHAAWPVDSPVVKPLRTGARSQRSESIRNHIVFRQSFRSMMRIEAQRRNASALRVKHSQSLANRRQRLSQPMVRSTIQRLGSTTNRPASDRLTISTLT